MVLEVNERLYAARGRHCLLWPEATTFLKSQRVYSQLEDATVCCGQRPQHSQSHREAIRDQRPPQFVVAKARNSFKVTEIATLVMSREN